MTTVGSYSLEDSEVAAFIFDVDGTLVDTMPTFFPSWIVACSQFGLQISEHQFYGLAGKFNGAFTILKDNHAIGKTLPEILSTLWLEQKGEKPTEEETQSFLKLKKAAHMEYEKANGSPKAIDCVVNIAHEAKKKGYKLACATSGLREHVEAHLSEAGIIHLFEHIVCAADLPPGRGKPHPDIFLEAARLLSVEPTQCRAFEDGESGLHAAWQAGMHVIDVRDLEGYPMHEALRKVMIEKRNTRTWLTR